MGQLLGKLRATGFPGSRTVATSVARSCSQWATRLACIERPVTEVQRSFDPSILERQVTAAADIQAFQVTGSSQPGTTFAVRCAASQRLEPVAGGGCAAGAACLFEDEALGEHSSGQSQCWDLLLHCSSPSATRSAVASPYRFATSSSASMPASAFALVDLGSVK